MGYVSYESICAIELWRYFDWSHWGELNPRPSPYQGDAIPLSHSGIINMKWMIGLTVAEVNDEFLNVIVKTYSGVRDMSRGRIARYCAGLESPWDFSLASSNLALGAKICIIHDIHLVRRMGFLFNATGLRITWSSGVTKSQTSRRVASWKG